MSVNIANQEYTSIQRDLNTTYPIARGERIPYQLAKQIGLSDSERTHGSSEFFGPYKTVRAQWTGEKRCPKKGEWFLSGAIVEAYLAKNDLSTPYHIAKLVRVRTQTIEIVEPIPDKQEDE